MQKGLWKCHEPRVTTNQEILTIQVTKVIYLDTDQELLEVTDFEGYHQKEGIRDVR